MTGDESVAGKKHSVDLTEGSIAPKLLRFALPIFVGHMLQNLYNLVDSLVAGNFAGTEALAAVSANADISILLVGFFVGLSTGAGVLFSRYFGGREYEKLRACIHTALGFSIVFGLVLSAVAALLSPALLRLVKCPEDVIESAIVYMRIYALGITFSAFYNIGSGVLRAVGNSRDPFIFLTVSGLTNVVLDIVFVQTFENGIAGVAWATVIAQIVSAVLVAANMLRTKDVYRVSIKDIRIELPILREIMELGLPSAVQHCLTSVSNLFVQGYVNELGSAALAGYGVAKKVDHFAGLATQSMAAASATFISQNLGAKKESRAFRGMAVSMGMCAVAVAAVGIGLYYNAEAVLRLFDDDGDTVMYGVQMMHCMLPLFYFHLSCQMLSHSTRGFGKSRAVMVLSLCGLVGVRQLFLAVGTRLSGSHLVIFYSMPAGWISATLFVGIYFTAAVLMPYLKRRKAGALQ